MLAIPSHRSLWLRRLVPAFVILLPLYPGLAEAGNMYEVFGPGGYSIESPPIPAAAGPDDRDLFYRWVPLCADGSGDHDWSLPGGASGVAPTCCADEYIRCIDGTRPIYYVDRARLADGSGDDDSDNWAFWFQGGGSCSDRPGADAGEVCSSKYTGGEHKEMGSSDDKRSIKGTGMFTPDHAGNEFRTYNRVRIMKCSSDRYTGDSTLPDTENVAGDIFDLYWHGRRIVDAVLTDLEGGIAFDDENGPNTLPPLTDASAVLLAGHSGGAGGLIFNLDWMAERIHGMEPAAKVRGLIDARFKPGVETEAAYDGLNYDLGDDNNGDGLLGPYDHVVPMVGSPGAIDGELLDPYHRGFMVSGGFAHTQQEQWAVNFDASCESEYGFGATPCRDEIHVLLNHVETPFFIRQALRDSSHVGQEVNWADSMLFRFTASQFKHRVLYQLERFLLGHHTLSVLGLGPVPPTWNMGVFATDTVVHDGNMNNTQFFTIEMCNFGVGTRYTYHDALVEWFTNDTEVLVVGDSGAVAGPWCDVAVGSCAAGC